MARGKVFFRIKTILGRGYKRAVDGRKTESVQKKVVKKFWGMDSVHWTPLATTLGMCYGPRLWLKYGASKLCE